MFRSRHRNLSVGGYDSKPWEPTEIREAMSHMNPEMHKDAFFNQDIGKWNAEYHALAWRHKQNWRFYS